MSKSRSILLSILGVAAALPAQANERGPGYDGALTNVYGARYWGRRGPAYPNGEVGISFANQLCNPGTININWFSPGGSIGAAIQTDHPKFGFLVARERDGRFIQISDWSYCKHAFFALSSPSVCGGTCQPTNGTQLGVSCSDIYSNSNNASRTYLGPPVEIDPWLGTWVGVGSYFDIGDPLQAGYPLPADGLRSLNPSIFNSDPVANRVTIREADIQSGAPMFAQIHVVIEGERIENRGNNTMSRGFVMAYSGGNPAWTAVDQGNALVGSVLQRWSGATVTEGTNGGTFTNADADGRFVVAVKVTGPVQGMWHYEYCVQNLDNSRGGAAFRLPVCPSARVTGLGFRDIDQNPLNDWTATVAGGEIAWTDSGNNAHNWNTLYNFWFDCDVAPSSGTATIDQARPGPGSLTVSVPTTVPGLQPAVHLGAGCGTPATELFVNGVPAAGNGSFAIGVAGGPGSIVMMNFSLPAGPVPLGSGCVAYLDLGNYVSVDLLLLNGQGSAALAIPLPPALAPLDLTFQGASFIPSPPLFGLFGLTNGLKVRFAQTGCD